MAEKNEIVTSLQIDFGTDTESSAKLEIDGRETGLNQGATSFYKGDSPGFILYATSNVVIDEIIASEGTVSAVGGGTVEQEEWLTFAKAREASLSYPAQGAVSVVKTVGISGTLTLARETTMVASSKVTGVAKVKYASRAKYYRLAGASGDNPVVIVFVGHVE